MIKPGVAVTVGEGASVAVAADVIVTDGVAVAVTVGIIVVGNRVGKTASVGIGTSVWHEMSVNSANNAIIKRNRVIKSLDDEDFNIY
jgi:hypothetical protein